MINLTTTDLHLVVSRLPKDIKKIVEERGLIVGGGFLRATIAGEKPSDIDIFGGTKDQLEAAARALKDGRHNSRLHSSQNAFTVLSAYRIPVQFIHRWLFSSPVECLRSFDFTVAQSAVWYSKESSEWQSSCNELFYPDLAAKRLTYCAPQRNEDAGGSLLRVRKFLSRGYNIQATSLAAVIARLCSSVRWDEIDNEERATKVICGLLREVDPLVAIDGIDLVNEHETLEEVK